MGSTKWVTLAAIVGSLVVGVVAYNAGLEHGAAAAAAAGGAAVPYVYGWGWHRPWGFGFGFPLFLILFWFVLLRGLLWGGPWRRRWYYYGGEVPPSFDDWHRRAHERMQDTPPSRV